MRYLLPSSVHQRLYYYRFNFKLYFFKQVTSAFIQYSKSQFFFHNSLSVSYYRNLIFFYFPKPRKFRRICWFNSKSHWVSKRFNFGRGYLKLLLNSNKIFNYRPRAW